LALAIHSGDLAVLGEFSGIRDYVLKPLPGAGSARRLRARSFRVPAFTHMIAREIRRRCDGSEALALDCAGGSDELADVSPANGLLLAGRAEDGAERAIAAYQAELDRWSLADLGGELVFHLAAVRCASSDIPYAALQGKLALRKMRPLEGALVAGARWNNAAFRSGWGDPHAKVCAGCGATVGDVSAGRFCDSCIDDDELGRLLPACNFGHWVEPDHSTVHVPGQGLALSTADRTMAGVGDLDLTTAGWAMLRYLPHGDFAALAERSPGRRKLLAYLAISVDAFAIENGAGVEPVPSADPVTEGSHAEEALAEVAVETGALAPVLSSATALDSPETAESEAVGEAAAAPSSASAFDSLEPPALAGTLPPPDSVAAHAHSLIAARFPDVYPIHGDRDTLLAAGPWDQVLHLALRLHQDFRETVRDNGGRLAFSAGLVLEHPVANLRSAVDHARAELARAQNGGPTGGRMSGGISSCISVFGKILPWKAAKDVADRGFEMAAWLKEDRISSSALRRVGELHSLSLGNRSTPGANHWKLRYLPLLVWQARDADRLLRRKILRLAADPGLWENTGLVTELAFLAAPVRPRGNPEASGANASASPVPSSVSALDSPAKAGGEPDG
jgi:hypothetical protein